MIHGVLMLIVVGSGGPRAHHFGLKEATRVIASSQQEQVGTPTESSFNSITGGLIKSGRPVWKAMRSRFFFAAG